MNESGRIEAGGGERRRDESPAALGRRLAAWWTFLKSAVTTIVGLFTALILGLLVFAIIQETSRDVVMIGPIAIPSSLADQGYTPSDVSRLLLDQIALINNQNESKSVNRPYLKRSKLFDTELGQLDVQLPGLGISLRSALSFLRGIVGSGQTEITGEIVEQGDKSLVLQLRVTTQDGQFSEIVRSAVATGSAQTAASLDDILSETLSAGAIRAVHDVDPYALAVYYLDKDQSKLPEVLQYCEDIDPSCKPWAALFRGLVFRERNDPYDLHEGMASFQDAIEEFRLSADTWPAYPVAYANLAVVELNASGGDFERFKVQGYSDAMNMFHLEIWLFDHHVRAIDAAAYDEFNIGQLYRMGYSLGPGNRSDCGRAESWYIRAANAGSALAQNSLGDLYNPRTDLSTCDGAPTQSDKEARYWYERAAAGGQVYAQRSLGEIYRDGKGLNGQRGPGLAVYYLRAAAQKDDVAALIDLGQIYRDGLGVYPDRIEPDLIKACAWFELAARADPDPRTLGMAPCNKRWVGVRMAGSNYSKAMKLVREWALGHRNVL